MFIKNWHQQTKPVQKNIPNHISLWNSNLERHYRLGPPLPLPRPRPRPLPLPRPLPATEGRKKQGRVNSLLCSYPDTTNSIYSQENFNSASLKCDLSHCCQHIIMQNQDSLLQHLFNYISWEINQVLKYFFFVSCLKITTKWNANRLNFTKWDYHTNGTKHGTLCARFCYWIEYTQVNWKSMKFKNIVSSNNLKTLQNLKSFVPSII